MFDVGKLTPAHTMATLVVAGAILDGFNLYEPLIDFAGAGATVPITSFGNALVHGAMEEAAKHGIVGVITGMFKVTSAGVSSYYFRLHRSIAIQTERIRCSYDSYR